MAPTPRIRIPTTARPGEVFEVKTLISHEMETGQRKDKDGKPIPRMIINKFVAKFNGKEILSVDWFSAVSANPYQSFYVRANESGTYRFEWHEDGGAVYSSEHKITVG